MVDTSYESSTAEALLSARTTGPVYAPGSAGYDAERVGYQLRAAHRPEAAIRASTEQDIVAGVRFAAQRGMRLAVQASGHGRSTGLSGGLLISTSAMSAVRVDAEAGTAWVEAGATWEQVVRAAAPHGLAPLSGSFPGVGAVSYTLGGGVGLLARRYGFAADHVRRIDLVTMDGQLRRVSAAGDAELFWALRGGAGNFGVVTGMEIELMPVEWIYGGSLYFDVERQPDILAAWREWTQTVPEEMTSAVSMLPMPDVPAVPEQLRGRHVAQVQVCWTGATSRGQRWVRPLRALEGVLRDTLGELAYRDSGAVFDEPDQPHAYLSENRLLRSLDSRALAELIERTGPSAPAMCVVGLRHLGGALARTPNPTNSVGRREAAYALTVLSPVQLGQDDMVRGMQRDAVEPFARDVLGRSLNFSFGPLDEAQVRAAFDPADYGCLVSMKARYDPDGMLHCNHPLPRGR